MERKRLKDFTEKVKEKLNPYFTMPTGQRVSKIEVYKWRLQDEPGKFKMLHKDELLIAPYQRTVIKWKKIFEWSANWSWVLCGTLTVALRDGKYYLIDGQHRKIAAKRRTDIDKLPCMVYRFIRIQDESRKFKELQTNRSGIIPTETFRSDLISEDPAALEVRELLKQTSHYIDNAYTAKSVRFPNALMKACIKNSEILNDIWPLFVTLHDGDFLNIWIFEGLFYLEENLRKQGKSVFDKDIYRKLITFKRGKLIGSIHEARMFYNKGGARIYAEGILRLINYKKVNKIELK